MSTGAIKKVVGKINIDVIDKDIVDKYDLKVYQNTAIIQDMNLYLHTYKHLKEFKTIDNYNYAIFNIDKIIKDPYYVFYDNEKKSFLYFKEMNEDVCAVVKLNIKKNKDTYVSTLYPINKNKIQKYKNKELMDKYIKNND